MNLLEINIKNTYAHKDTKISFKDGINYIVGKNESGKTVVLNMIAYALFGSGALRGPASDYKKLFVSLSFKINNTHYIVERSTKDIIYEVVSEIIDDKVDLKLVEKATGKSPVNLFISGILGYGLDVFNKMNFSQQLEGDSYANSKKSERLDLINKINGVDEANQLEKYLESKKRSYKSEIKGLDMSSIVNNVEFTPNTKLDHLSEKDLEILSTESKEIYNKLSELNSISTAYNMIPEEPQWPSALFHPSSLVNPYTGVESSLDEYLDAYRAHLSQLELLENSISQRNRYLSTNSFYDKNGEYIQLSDLLRYESIIDNNKKYTQKQELLCKGSINCPHCKSEFPLMHSALDGLEDFEYIEPPFTESELRRARVFVEMHLENCNNYVQEISHLESEKDLLLSYEFKVKYEDALASQKESSDFNRKLQTRKEALERFNTSYSAFTDINSLLVQIDNLNSKLSSVSDRRIELESYLREKGVYLSAQKAKSQIDVLVKDKQEKIKAYEALVDQSKAIKLEIQNNSIPSLNKKASSIVNKMTGGEHFSLSLSDTFELLLDGKIITAYSGSTQVTANVAFRIALIETFYKKTFPVFIGDEIDSFADNTRAEHIHKALNKLAEEGYQIILISHHSLNFEGNVIDLNKIKGKS